MTYYISDVDIPNNNKTNKNILNIWFATNKGIRTEFSNSKSKSPI